MAKFQKRSAAKRPTHRAYYVTGEGDNRYWHELGPVWTHQDGEGFTLLPNVLPAPGEAITIRKIEDKKKAGKPSEDAISTESDDSADGE